MSRRPLTRKALWTQLRTGGVDPVPHSRFLAPDDVRVREERAFAEGTSGRGPLSRTATAMVRQSEQDALHPSSAPIRGRGRNMRAAEDLDLIEDFSRRDPFYQNVSDLDAFEESILARSTRQALRPSSMPIDPDDDLDEDLVDTRIVAPSRGSRALGQAIRTHVRAGEPERAVWAVLGAAQLDPTSRAEAERHARRAMGRAAAMDEGDEATYRAAIGAMRNVDPERFGGLLDSLHQAVMYDKDLLKARQERQQAAVKAQASKSRLRAAKADQKSVREGLRTQRQAAKTSRVSAAAEAAAARSSAAAEAAKARASRSVTAQHAAATQTMRKDVATERATTQRDVVVTRREGQVAKAKHWADQLLSAPNAQGRGVPLVPEFGAETPRPKSKLMPIFEPEHNFREIAKQLVLLEDHLVHPPKRCGDCIRKHLLTAEALAEEAATLDKTGKHTKLTSWLPGRIRGVAQRVLAGDDKAKLAQEVRQIRKRLSKLAFGAVLGDDTARFDDLEDVDDLGGTEGLEPGQQVLVPVQGANDTTPDWSKGIGAGQIVGVGETVAGYPVTAVPQTDAEGTWYAVRGPNLEGWRIAEQVIPLPVVQNLFSEVLANVSMPLYEESGVQRSVFTFTPKTLLVADLIQAMVYDALKGFCISTGGAFTNTQACATTLPQSIALAAVCNAIYQYRLFPSSVSHANPVTSTALMCKKLLRQLHRPSQLRTLAAEVGSGRDVGLNRWIAAFCIEVEQPTHMEQKALARSRSAAALQGALQGLSMSAATPPAAEIEDPTFTKMEQDPTFDPSARSPSPLPALPAPLSLPPPPPAQGVSMTTVGVAALGIAAALGIGWWVQQSATPVAASTFK